MRKVWCGCIRTGSDLKKILDITYKCVKCDYVFVIYRLDDVDEMVILCTDHKHPTVMKFLAFTNELDNEGPHHSIYMCPACKKRVLLEDEDKLK